MLKLLAVDTSTEACSAALHLDGEVLHRYQLAPRQHSQLILQMIEGLLHEADLRVADLNALAFGRGPGSFMGVRIAAGVVQGIAFSHNLPVVPVSTLQAIAHVAMLRTGEPKILAAIDARMAEVYWGAYVAQGAEGLVLQGEECVTPPELAPLPPGDRWVAAGSGWASYAGSLSQRASACLHSVVDDCFPSAEAMASLAVKAYQNGGYVAAAEAVPVYLRDNVAKKPSVTR